MGGSFSKGEQRLYDTSSLLGVKIYSPPPELETVQEIKPILTERDITNQFNISNQNFGDDVLKDYQNHQLFNEKQISYSLKNNLTVYEKQNIFLEGTGSLVLDRVNKTVYMAESNRSNVSLASKWSQLRGYDLVHFKSYIDQKPTYHTNVLMFITDKFTGICFESISDYKYLQSNIKKTHKILNLSIEQIKNFSGNAMVVRNINNESKFLISSSGLKALDLIQIKFIEKYYDIVEINIPTIERIGGGSVRCMLLELF